MKRYIFSILTCFLFVFNGLSQANDGMVTDATIDMDLDGLINVGDLGNVDIAPGKTIGTPFLDKDWLIGKVYTKKGPIVENVALNLDLYTNRVLMKRSEGAVFKLNSSKLKALEVSPKNDDRTYFFKSIPADSVEGIYEDKFYEVLYRPDNLILKSHNKNYKKADFKRAYGSGNTQDEFKNVYKYYVKGEDGIYRKITLGKKSLIKKIGSEKGGLIADYAKKNKFVVLDENSLLELVNNSLN
ncbi:MAG: hypothetical protein AAF363_22210 [Bacteroidota bacterium]